MAWMKMKPALIAAALALLSTDAQAWVTPMRSSVVRRSTGGSILKMAEDEESIDKVQITSARKELMFDEAKGRFFETNIEKEECIPDEEFCSIDSDTGERMRLTIGEKERIFLDSLQVSQFSYK